MQCCNGVCGTVQAMAYRAYAIRYKWRKPNTPKTTSDVRKTMSYVEKIMSDIIQTTSDLFSPTCNALENRCLRKISKKRQQFVNQYVIQIARFCALRRLQTTIPQLWRSGTSCGIVCFLHGGLCILTAFRTRGLVVKAPLCICRGNM